MRHMILLGGVVAGACVLLVAMPACATPNFPGAVQRSLGASQTPPCSICHVCGITGRGTVNTPWGAAMRSRGLTAFDEASLSNALASMERDAVDSNGDGLIDVDAVRMGDDPNPANTCSPEEDDTIPKYGCVGRISPSPPRTNALGLLVAAIVIIAGCRRRFSWQRDAHQTEDSTHAFRRRHCRNVS